MFKKILLAALIVILVLPLVACKPRADSQKDTNQSVPETGRVIDISGLNYQVIFAVPGDALLISLKANKDSGYQWSFREPITGSYLTLKRHDIITENDSRLKPDELISEWKFKVEKASQFNLRLDYEKPLISKQPKEIFLVKIISDLGKDGVAKILVDLPVDGSSVSSPLKLSGFAAATDGQVSYLLKDENNKVLATGLIKTKAAAPAFGYFEKEIKFSRPKSSGAVLEIFQVNVKDGGELDKVTVELTMTENK